MNEEEERKKLRLEFYYSTSLLQHILISLERIGQPRLKKDVARNLCKWLVIDGDGVLSKGMVSKIQSEGACIAYMEAL